MNNQNNRRLEGRLEREENDCYRYDRKNGSQSWSKFGESKEEFLRRLERDGELN